jgi:hypothetical protein
MQTYVEQNLAAAVSASAAAATPRQQVAPSAAAAKEREAITDVFKEAGAAACLMAPVVTATGIAMVFAPRSPSMYMDFTVVERMLGVPVAIGGIVVDAVKLPVLATFSLGAALYGVGRWLKSLVIRPTDTETQSREIMQSAAIRFANTCKLLVAIQLETSGSIKSAIDTYQQAKCDQDKTGMLLLCAFTALNTAFASRRLPVDCILLANGKVLVRKACPSSGRAFFDAIVRLRHTLIHSVPAIQAQTNAQATPTLLHFIPQLHALLVASGGKINKAAAPSETLLRLANDMTLAGKCAVGSSQLRDYPYSMEHDARQAVDSVPAFIPENKDRLEENQGGVAAAAAAIAPVAVYRCLRDARTNKPITHQPIVQEDGLVYESASLTEAQQTKGQLLYACRTETPAGQAFWDAEDDDLRIDPITCDDMISPVIANDGFLYDATTFALLKRQKLVGRGGVVLTRCIACHCHLWRSL